MLWHKSWAESRARFLIAVLVMLLACTFAVVWRNDRVIFHGFPQTLFTLLTIVLGMGGLLRERELGTAGFTLALPVSRTRLTVTRVVVAAVEVAALTLVPLIVLTVASVLMWRVHPIEASLIAAGRWLIGVVPVFALACFASVILAGEYTSFVATFTAFFFETVSLQLLRLARPETRPYLFTLQEIMGGIRPITPGVVALLAGVAVGLMLAALSWEQRRDF